MAGSEPPLRILFSTPAYWPALPFGGPVWEARELGEGLVRRGHHVDVFTTTLQDVATGRSFRTSSAEIAGVHVRYLATPLRYRWMGITPTAPLWLHRLERPDVVHVFGFRDPIGAAVAAWCRLHRVPYVLQPLGMLMPQLRKVRLKRAFDAAALRWMPAGCTTIVVASGRERDQVIASGAQPEKVVVRGNGFPAPAAERVRSGVLRNALGIGVEPLLLYVGRIADGKGIELLLEAVRRMPDVHLALVGPDGGHGVSRGVETARRDPATAGRIHRLEPDARPLELYGDADVFVLPSAGESFGMAAAEAAAAGTPVVVTDRCGVAETFGEDEALVIPYDVDAVHAAVERVLRDEGLCERLSAGGRAAAAAHSWDAIVDRQERIYRNAISHGR